MIREIQSHQTLLEVMHSEQLLSHKQDVRILNLVDLEIASIKDNYFRRGSQGPRTRFRTTLNTALTASK